MTADLTGGLPPAREYLLAERPENPELRDSVSMWVFADDGSVGLPRIGIEAVGANWAAHDLQVNVAFPDGRAYRLRANAPSWSASGASGAPDTLGAGGLAFRCVQPFDTWTLDYAGPAVRTSSADLAAGRTQGPTVDVQFSVETRMAVPPWIQGTMIPGANGRLPTTEIGELMGGERYEQLMTAVGTVAVEGGPEHRFTGRGLRIRRQGVRRLAGFWGHCWQSAVFPSGRAFGYIAYPPRADGQPTYNEGYVWSGEGPLQPARVVHAPWLTRLQALGENVGLVLETATGTVAIEGETVVSTHDVHHADDTWSMNEVRKEMPAFPAVHQAGVRYRWDGEEAYGMLERSNPMDKITSGLAQDGGR